SSPMGLLWTFMGYSKPYTIFAGASEVVGGMLLFFRRTTTLGALLLVAVVGNIVILNFSYDVPVKLFSSNLLVMAIFLVLPDLRRLANLLLLNRPVDAVRRGPLFATRWMNHAAVVAKVLFIGYALFHHVDLKRASTRTYGDNVPKHALYGIYDVEEFIRN